MKKYQLCAIGNALVDMEFKIEDSFLEACNIDSVLRSEITLAKLQQEGIGIVAVEIPHHGGVGAHRHDVFTDVAGVDHRKLERSLVFTVHVAEIVFHLPRALGLCEV